VWRIFISSLCCRCISVRASWIAECKVEAVIVLELSLGSFWDVGLVGRSGGKCVVSLLVKSMKDGM